MVLVVPVAPEGPLVRAPLLHHHRRLVLEVLVVLVAQRDQVHLAPLLVHGTPEQTEH